MILLPVALAAAMYARFFGGFWLGDDFANLHRTWFAAQRGGLLAQTWSELAGTVPSQGAFYRPLMTASLSLNQWLAADRFAGWFAFSYLVHLANAALVAALVARLAAACGRDGRVAGALAAAFFAVSPLLAEGVFWVSARSDPCVTLLTLAGFFLWAAPNGNKERRSKAWLGLPLLLVPALGFKESAAVLPLQLVVIAARLAAKTHARTACRDRRRFRRGGGVPRLSSLPVRRCLARLSRRRSGLPHREALAGRAIARCVVARAHPRDARQSLRPTSSRASSRCSPPRPTRRATREDWRWR